MNELVPSFDPPEQWRSKKQKKKLDQEEWKNTRMRILNRDNYSCRYCGYSASSFMNVDHIDGDPENNSDKNLQTLCMWCHMVKHAGLHAAIKGSLELYKKPRGSNQVSVIKSIRMLRGEKLSDEEIKRQLKLTEPMQFKMDYRYLSGSVGFINSRKIYENGRCKIYGNITIRYKDGSYPSVFCD